MMCLAAISGWTSSTSTTRGPCRTPFGFSRWSCFHPQVLLDSSCDGNSVIISVKSITVLLLVNRLVKSSRTRSACCLSVAVAREGGGGGGGDGGRLWEVSCRCEAVALSKNLGRRCHARSGATVTPGELKGSLSVYWSQDFWLPMCLPGSSPLGGRLEASSAQYWRLELSPRGHTLTSSSVVSEETKSRDSQTDFSLLYATAALRGSLDVVLELWKFCLEGAGCSAVRCQATRGVRPCHRLVSGTVNSWLGAAVFGGRAHWQDVS